MAYSWVELCDWIPSVLACITAPRQVKAGIGAAGHKALYRDGWGGLPDKEFLALLDPKLADLKERLYVKAHDATEPAGTLCAEWGKTRSPWRHPDRDRRVRCALRCHGCRVREGTLVKVTGTSTCDCAVVSATKQVPDIPGICGLVKGAILPGYYGLEAGQSTVGDIFKWWVEGVCAADAATHARFTADAQLAPGESGLLALDWNNSNRTILVDPMLSGLLLGQTLHTTSAEGYRALIEATAFSARAIIERFREYGVPIDRVVCASALRKKSYAHADLRRRYPMQWFNFLSTTNMPALTTSQEEATPSVGWAGCGLSASRNTRATTRQG